MPFDLHQPISFCSLLIFLCLPCTVSLHLLLCASYSLGVLARFCCASSVIYYPTKSSFPILGMLLYTLHPPLATTSCSSQKLNSESESSNFLIVYKLSFCLHKPPKPSRNKRAQNSRSFNKNSNIHFTFSTPESDYCKGLWVHLLLKWRLHNVQFLK